MGSTEGQAESQEAQGGIRRGDERLHRSFALTFDDPDHSAEEKRFITIGTSSKERILFLSHVDRGEDHIRIISARLATTTEAHAYQESRK